MREWMAENPDDARVKWVKENFVNRRGGVADGQTDEAINAGMQSSYGWSPASRARWSEAERRYYARWDERELGPSLFRNK